ncbi:MAG: MarR family transcriptional regulator [Phormidesmis priestleyi]|uniref:MarR family transcriptional regulator n=1 Tax=Phormidesmis priestleyi TaxID=268141 RepID=A0A2W4WMJ1_9CYAN|nr:MAG: MarR family transcriptional regulator [Phormidesmis priestleyi]
MVSSAHNRSDDIIAIAQQMSQACVARRLRQVTRTVTRLYDDALRPHGITVNQLNILAVIISERTIRPGQLGQTLGMEKSTVSRTTERMANKGWIKVAQGKDSRTQLITVTAKGRQLLIAVTPIWDTLQSSLLTTGGHNLLNMLTINESTNESTVSDPMIEPYESVPADDFYL